MVGWRISSFPGSSAGKESACIGGDPQFDSCVGKIPWINDIYRLPIPVFLSFPGGSDGKKSVCSARDLGLIPELGRSPRGGHGNPLQYSWVENPHEQRSLAGCSPWNHRESDMTEQPSTAQHSMISINTNTINKVKWVHGHAFYLKSF